MGVQGQGACLQAPADHDAVRPRLRAAGAQDVELPGQVDQHTQQKKTGNASTGRARNRGDLRARGWLLLLWV